jgi:hypothetical protein
VHVYDFNAPNSKVTSFKLEVGCVALRARENEDAKPSKHSDASLSVQCPDGRSKIINGAGEYSVNFVAPKSADVTKMFVKTGTKQFIRMLADL